MKCVAKTIAYAVAELDSKPKTKKKWRFGKKKKKDQSEDVWEFEETAADDDKWVEAEKRRIAAAEDVRYRSNGPCLPGVP